jgi:hypothetical protein
MRTTAIGLFDSFDAARDAVDALIAARFRPEDISVIAQEDDDAGLLTKEVHNDTAGAGAATGAMGGSMLGGALGLLVGTGLLLIPGVGPVLAVGPLAAAIGTTTAAVGATAVGAGVGAAAGGLIGSLTDVGVSREDAGLYAEGVRRGGRLVSVQAEGADLNRAHEILQRAGAVNIQDRVNDWGAVGQGDTPPMGDRSARGMGSAAASYDADFRDHYLRTYSTTGASYERFMPAYMFGLTMADDPRYRSQEWDRAEADLGREWGQHQSGSWEEFKAGVRYAWDRARSAAKGH